MSRRKERSTSLPVPKPKEGGPRSVKDVPGAEQGVASTGRPLDPATRSTIEPLLGEDFSRVRVHTDDDAARSADAASARAFSVGDDIVFGEGRYEPGSQAGARLLAHELAHVAQQRRPGSGQGSEERAQAVADEVATGNPVSPAQVGSAPVGVHCDEGDRPSFPAPGPRFQLDPDITKLTMATIDRFDHNSATLKAEHQGRIAFAAEMLVGLLTKVPGRVTVTGHTDLTGGEDYNLDLGRKRADAVRDALVKAGVLSTLISIDTAGEAKPAVKTEAQEPRNRRVEIRFEGTPLPELSPPTLFPGASGPGPVAPPGGGIGGGVPNPWSWNPRAPLLPAPTFPGKWSPPPLTPPLFTPGKGPETPREGTVGDVLKAITTIPAVDKAIDDILKTQLDRLESLKPGEKVLLGGTGLLIGVGAIAGIASDPAATKSVLDFIDGKTIPVPKVPGLGVQVLTKGGPGGVIQIDFVKIFEKKKK